MGEKQNQPFQLSFNPFLRVDFQGLRVTSDSGVLLVRELDERLGLSVLMAEHLTDDRGGKNTQLPLPDLLRKVHLSRLAGYEDVNDAERLSQVSSKALSGRSNLPINPCETAVLDALQNGNEVTNVKPAAVKIFSRMSTFYESLRGGLRPRKVHASARTSLRTVNSFNSRLLSLQRCCRYRRCTGSLFRRQKLPRDRSIEH